MPSAALERLTRALNENGVGYALIGGIAVSLVAKPRFTADIDAVLWHLGDDFGSTLEALRSRGFESRSEKPLEFARRHRMLLLADADGVGIDLSLGALPFEEETVRNALRIEVVPGLEVRVARPEALVVMKALAARPRDLEDIRELLRMNPDLDRKYVNKRLGEFADVLDSPDLVEQLKAIYKAIDAEPR